MILGSRARHGRFTSYADMHCHILPGLDDGARDWDDAVRMAVCAKASGATKIVATPHYLAGECEPSPDEVRVKVQELQVLLDENGIGVGVLPGSEVHLNELLYEDYRVGKLVPIGSSRYVLVELPFDTMPCYTADVLFRLGLAGAGVILAHPERNRDIQADLRRLEALVNGGVLVQLNGGSLLGSYGRDVKACAERIVRIGLFHFIGSDAHTGKVRSAFDRGADIGEALKRMERLVDPEIDVDLSLFEEGPL